MLRSKYRRIYWHKRNVFAHAQLRFTSLLTNPASLRRADSNIPAGQLTLACNERTRVKFLRTGTNLTRSTSDLPKRLTLQLEL